MANPVKDAGQIGQHMGNVWKVLEVTESGPAGTEVAADWIDLGHNEEMSLEDDTPFEDIFSEDGNSYATLEQNRTVKVTLLLQQTSKDMIDFFKETVRAKFYTIYHYMGTLDGKYQEAFYGICRIKPMIKISDKTRRLPVEITILNNSSSIGIGGTSEAEMPAGAHATTATIAADERYAIVETAV